MTGEVSAPRAYRERNSTADRALDVLQLFTDDRLVWSGAEISEHLGVARSTGYRYLQSLVRSGFIEECDGGFRLGPRIIELARIAQKGMRLADVARPVMRALADEIGETVLLTHRSGASVVCLELEESTRPIRLSYDRGHVLPLNAGAAAQVLLAWLTPEEVAELVARAPLQRFTDRTIHELGAFLERLATIRENGVAVSRGELDEDVLGVAAPVWTNGAVRAGLSIAALSARLPESAVPRVTDAVRTAADAVTARLGDLS